jgi:hypothetical protein
MGEFRETIYPPTDTVTEPQVRGYDIGVGGQLTVGMPLSKNLAFRVGFSGMGTQGTDTARGYTPITLNHSMFSLSGELQVFFDDAYWHRGPYAVAGVSADFERFESSYDEAYYYDPWEPQWIDVSRKNRLGCTFGVGQIFGRSGGMRLTLEATYHVTITGKDPLRLDPPPTDFLKVGFGVAF